MTLSDCVADYGGVCVCEPRDTTSAEGAFESWSLCVCVGYVSWLLARLTAVVFYRFFGAKQVHVSSAALQAGPLSVGARGKEPHRIRAWHAKETVKTCLTQTINTAHQRPGKAFL